MKFAVLVAIVAEELEEKTRKIASEAGAAGVTILNGRGSAGEERKSFFGLTYEGSQTILLYILEKKLLVKVFKEIKKFLNESQGSGLAFSLPIEHLSGLNLKDLEKFEEQIKEEL